MGDSTSASYIHMVHRLIEECLVFDMSKQDCVEALSRHANIKPVITSTVWNELEKENEEFFEAYTRRTKDKPDTTNSSQRIQSLLSDSTSTTRDNN